ncbi:response regulator transcription factor [Neorhizobium sp. LjRoot104]|uniref:response regulator transcription factor n=1 Tax=Neorhizobium sp. LjRoot104 TaxID=3342254 RepID=UPI003ECCDD12
MSTSNLIYLLEDEIDLASVFRRALEESGIAVEHFRRLHEFRSALKTRRPSLCIIDLGLPDGDGLCLLGEELGSETIPTIVVSGRTSLNAKLIGLEQGADDYLSKPVEPAELVARVKTVLRRAGRQEGQPVRKHQETAEQLVARFGDWICDFESFTLTDIQGKAYKLSRAETDLLRIFLETQGRVITRDYLLQTLFANGEEPFDRSVDVRVSRLRKKLDCGAPQIAHIRTVYGAGYVFTPSVEWLG